eukprot:m.5556 g.5556  ORF g.5556 m.5556 type:complete len:534 (+) comp2396_c0_seq1:156-1757(+)
MAASSSSTSASRLNGCQGWVKAEDEQEYAALYTTSAAARGLLVTPRDNKGLGRAARFAVTPSTLLPTAIPRCAYEEGRALQGACNRLMVSVARDTAFLKQHLTNTAAAGDDFTGGLLNIMDVVQAEQPDRYRSDPMFGVFRTDYMLHCPPGTAAVDSRVLMVEANTIAASFGMLAAKAARLHRSLLSQHLATTHAATQADVESCVPLSDFDVEVPRAFARAHALYLERWLQQRGADQPVPTEGVVIVMVVQPNEYNAFDQHLLIQALWETHGLRTVRLSLQQIQAVGRIGSYGELLLDLPASDDAPVEASIVYFRAGYSPADFPDQTAWDARLLIERSTAIACPNIALHLAGTKKVQQVLTDRKVLSKFLSAEEVPRVLATFAGLYSLDPADVDDRQPEKDGAARVAAVVAEARSQPHLYVLKPQREGGGGNNLFDEDLVRGLDTLGSALTSYIVMDRILPPAAPASLLTDRLAFSRDKVHSELGIFGAILHSGNAGEVLNTTAGHLLRTKLTTSTETGVAAGAGVLDSPFLV